MQSPEQKTLSQECQALKKEVAQLKKALRDSQQWNWISAQERAEDAGHDYYEIDEMQRLHEIAFCKNQFTPKPICKEKS